MKLTRKFLNNWLEEFKQNWLNKDIEKAISHFSKIEGYYENIFWKPTNDINKIAKFWQEIKKQKIKELRFEIITIENNIGIIHWFFVDDTGTYDGIYQINFDKNLNCIQFKQWYTKK